MMGKYRIFDKKKSVGSKWLILLTSINSIFDQVNAPFPR